MGKDEEIRIDLPEEEVEEMHIPASERFIKPNWYLSNFILLLQAKGIDSHSTLELR